MPSPDCRSEAPDPGLPFQPDGLLPETYDSDTGTWLARHWFAWPSAVLAALALGAADLVAPETRS